jgi:hypothetical protein
MKKILHILFAITVIDIDSFPQPQAPAMKSISPVKLIQPKLVDRFYTMNDHQLFWFGNNETTLRRSKLVSLLDSAAYLALNKNNYHYERLKMFTRGMV